MNYHGIHKEWCQHVIFSAYHIDSFLFLWHFTVESAAIMSWCYIYYKTSVLLYTYGGYVTVSEYYVSAASNGVPYPSTALPCYTILLIIHLTSLMMQSSTS